MRSMYEMFLTSSEDWMQSSIMVNIRNRQKGKKTGKFVWKKFETLRDELLSCSYSPNQVVSCAVAKL